LNFEKPFEKPFEKLFSLENNLDSEPNTEQAIAMTSLTDWTYAEESQSYKYDLIDSSHFLAILVRVRLDKTILLIHSIRRRFLNF
jgi:hypothetical protein